MILHVILPLLRLVTKTSATEKDLATKAGGILRNKLSHVKEVPSQADVSLIKELLEEVHSQARRAATPELTNTCSACSLFLIRTLDASSPKSAVGVDTYRKTLADLMTRKRTLVRVPFIAEFVKRYPARAFPLATDLAGYLSSKEIKQAFKRTQAISILSAFAQQLRQIAEAVPRDQVEAFVSACVEGTYELLEGINETEEKWDKGQIREIVKFQLQLARTSKNALGENVLAVWDVERLEKVAESIAVGSKTAQLKGLHHELKQLRTLLVGKQDKADKAGGKKADDQMDVDEVADVKVGKAEKKSKKVKAEGEAKAKKRKSTEGKGSSSAKEGKKAKVAA